MHGFALVTSIPAMKLDGNDNRRKAGPRAGRNQYITERLGVSSGRRGGGGAIR